MASKKFSQRHRRAARSKQEIVDRISAGSIRRLARRGGVKRMSGLIYDEVRNVLKDYLERVMKPVCLYIEHSKRRTATVSDVVHALKSIGQPLVVGHGGY
jgi:histone H4